MFDNDNVIKTPSSSRWVTRSFQPKRIKIADFKDSLSKLLTENGEILIDEKNNTVTVNDSLLAIMGIERTINSLEELAKEANPNPLSSPLLQDQETITTRRFKLNFAKVTAVKDILTQLLGERGRLVVDERTNIVIATDTVANLKILENSLEFLDEQIPQVLIEVKVVETNADASKNLGIKWNISGTAIGAKKATTFPFNKKSKNTRYFSDDFPSAIEAYPGGPYDPKISNIFSFGTLDASDFSIVMQALFEDKDTKMLSAPRITTLDNNPAKIEVVSQDPVPKYSYSGEIGQWEITGFDWMEYGVVLNVTPKINNNEFVTLEATPEISEKVGERNFSSASGMDATIPIFYTQSASTKVTVRNNDTLVIGGLIKEKTVETVSKVPVLGSIPVVGNLFKHKSKEKTNRDLLIFITPKIIKID